MPLSLISAVRVLPALVLAVCCSVTPSFSAATTKALKFHQTHFFLGKCDMTVARDAFRMDNLGNLRFSVVAKAPDWTVTLYRDDEKIYFSESLADLLDTGILSEFLVVRKARYVDPSTHRKLEVVLSGYKIVCMDASDQILKYMPLERAGVPSQIEKLAYGIYKMPTGGGIPISYVAAQEHKDFFVSRSKAGGRHAYFDTTKIEAVDVTPAFFDLPKGYKKAASVRAIVSGKNSMEMSEDALQTFGRDIEPVKRK